MKASIKFREDQKPLLRAKVPLSILGLPFQSGVVSGESKELSLNLGTFFESGPSLKLAYRPNDSLNPFSLVFKTGIGHFGSPISSPMTMSAEFNLIDFLTKAGAVTEEDVRIPVVPQPPPGYVSDPVMNAAQFQAPPPHVNGPGAYGVDSVGFGNGIDGRVVAVGAGGSSGGGGRGKRRAVEEPPMDKATQQKQRRMIKNRESAARSRERKQAYTVELESLVTQLEEENARLLREEAQQSQERYKQLMENLIPVVEKRRPPRALRRMNSM